MSRLPLGKATVKQVEVALVQQGGLIAAGVQPAGGCQAAEAGSDDDHVFSPLVSQGSRPANIYQR